MTIEKARKIVNEVRAVLARHNAALVGSDWKEGTYAEIAILDAAEVPAFCGRKVEPGTSLCDYITIEAIAPEEAA